MLIIIIKNIISMYLIRKTFGYYLAVLVIIINSNSSRSTSHYVSNLRKFWVLCPSKSFSALQSFKLNQITFPGTLKERGIAINDRNDGDEKEDDGFKHGTEVYALPWLPSCIQRSSLAKVARLHT